MATRYRRMRDLREDHDLTQKELCEKISMSPNQYSLYEHGTRETPVSLLIQLAQLYHTSIDYLVELTDDPNPPPPRVMYPKSARRP